MSTRSMIAVQWYPNGSYSLYYRHSDGYPEGLGTELIEALKEGLSIDKVLEKVGAKDEKKTVNKPEDAFLSVQGDLEWIYVIENPDSENTNLRILKTSCPYFWGLAGNDAGEKEFVFPVWFSYVKYFPSRYTQIMAEVDRMADIALRCLEAYVKAPSLVEAEA